MRRPRRWRVALVVLVLPLMLGGAGCSPDLPEPESQAAQLYTRRCSGCHRLYHPKLLTADMWAFMLARMDEEFQRLGRPLLQGQERKTVLDYLQRHSGKS